jgi:hypothetical protein
MGSRDEAHGPGTAADALEPQERAWDRDKVDK